MDEKDSRWYAQRRNDWLSNAENSINAMRREIGASRYEMAALAARDAARALEHAGAEHNVVLKMEAARAS